MAVESLHHVAYRCKDAQQTVDFYTKVLGLKFTMAMAEDKVPSTREDCPYMHIFFQMKDGSHVAFFELPDAKPMGRDTNTPEWVQHLALRVTNEAELLEYKKRAQDWGCEVIGPVDHTIFSSIYFFDPSGNRLELSANIANPDAMTKLDATRDEMLREWNVTKRPPRQASFVHAKLP